MRILFFTSGDENVPSSRYRVYFMKKELKKHGIVVRINPPIEYNNILYGIIKTFFIRIIQLSRTGKNDVIYAQKLVYLNITSLLIIIYKKIFGKKLIFDLDDSMFVLKRKTRFFLFGRNITNFMLRISDAVIVSSHYLMNYAKKYNKKVFLITTAVRMINFKKSKKDKNSKFNIGWIGIGKVHEKNLELLIKPLKELGKKYGLKFTIMGSTEKIERMFKNIDGIELDVPKTNWLDQLEIEKEISKFDVGLMPLKKDEITLGKPAFKCKQYMSMKVPTVSSPIGELNYLIKDGFNGFLASSEKEWIEKIAMMIENKKLRNKISKNALETIKNEHTFEIVGKNLAETLKSEFRTHY